MEDLRERRDRAPLRRSLERKKKLSKKYYGTSHVISKDEAKFVFEKGCEQLIVGSGQEGNVHLSAEAEAYFAKKGCKVRCSRPPRSDPSVQQIKCKEDRAFSRDLLKLLAAGRAHFPAAVKGWIVSIPCSAAAKEGRTIGNV